MNNICTYSRVKTADFFNTNSSLKTQCTIEIESNQQIESRVNMTTAREWDNLRVVTHNINGLKEDRLKLLNIIKWLAEHHL